MKEQYVSGSKIKEQFEVSTSSLQRWANNGEIQSIRTPGNQRLYLVDDVKKIFCKDKDLRKKVCYARVSSDKQKEDLGRQVAYLKERFPEHQIIQDIASGLNWNRKGLKTILDECFKGNISEVVVTYRDRLCRIGFELVQYIFEKTNTKLVVCYKAEIELQDELSEDLLSIITFYVAKNNGARSNKYNITEKKKEQDDQQQQQSEKQEQD